METTLYRTQVHSSDVRDLFIALTLKLSEAKYQLVMLWECLNRILDKTTEVALSVKVVGLSRVVFELKWTVVVVPVVCEALKEH